MIIILQASFIQTGKGVGIDVIPSLFKPKSYLLRKEKRGSNCSKLLKNAVYLVSKGQGVSMGELTPPKISLRNSFGGLL